DKSFPEGYVHRKEKLVNDLIANNEALLEITAFDPQYFGKDRIIKLKQGRPVYNLDVRDVMFGTYQFDNFENDVALVQTALATNRLHWLRFELDKSSLIRTFIPI